VDIATEKEIFDRLQKRNCGMMILTHRLSAISLCDEVYVLQKGQIVQRGTPEELAQAEGPFKQMLLTESA
jgi:ABC-type multidrug transport system fused ATPase/permease subunit